MSKLRLEFLNRPPRGYLGDDYSQVSASERNLARITVNQLHILSRRDPSTSYTTYGTCHNWDMINPCGHSVACDGSFHRRYIMGLTCIHVSTYGPWDASPLRIRNGS